MKCGIYNSDFIFQEVNTYDIKSLCKSIVNKITSQDYQMKLLFYEYQKNITRFDPNFEFCLHELGLCVLDPLGTGKDQILLSHNKHTYLLQSNPFNDSYKPKDFNLFDSKTDIIIDYPTLTDKNVGYRDNFQDMSNITEGIADSYGYVDSFFVRGIDNLAKIELIDEMLGNKNYYDEDVYLLKHNIKPLEILTNRSNCISIKRNPDGKFSIEFLSENTGKLKEFIDNLSNNNLISD